MTVSYLAVREFKSKLLCNNSDWEIMSLNFSKSKFFSRRKTIVLRVLSGFCSLRWNTITLWSEIGYSKMWRLLRKSSSMLDLVMTKSRVCLKMCVDTLTCCCKSNVFSKDVNLKKLFLSATSTWRLKSPKIRSSALHGTTFSSRVENSSKIQHSNLY